MSPFYNSIYEKIFDIKIRGIFLRKDAPKYELL